ncbi:MAG: LuxR C-terminal-related transcriptional regulator [Chloroflexota bacterium]|nr:LuxR C-terminal-related transcriptional regulator [Chloroflexota bacterium]
MTPIPVPLSSLLGRERDLAMVTARLRDPRIRLLTLTGPGGVGKTRLALAAASDVAGELAAGACFVPLAPIRDPTLVSAVIARALGLLDGTEPAPDQVIRRLRHRHLLLVLDNFEHLLAAAPWIATLLAACPALTVLATSRERLRLHGERELAVPPLAVPNRARADSTAELAGVAAVRLFVERSRDVEAAFVLTPDNAGAVAELCRRLDGLPLAIELAAARAKVLPPHALLARLERRLPLLIGANRDTPERQRTLRDAIAWSHDLLTPAEQTLFRRLAVFAGGFTLDAAEVVVSTMPAGSARTDRATTNVAAAAPEAIHHTQPLDLIESLVNKSLLRRAERTGEAIASEPRFAMLETVREFALERLDASDEREMAWQAHATYFLALAERAEPKVMGRDQGRWLGRLDAEIDNVRATLSWALSAADGSSAIALQLAGALWTFWAMSGRSREGRDWLERALAAGDGTITVHRARALQALGTIYGTLSEFARSESLLSEAVAAWRALGDPSGTGRALQMLAVAMQQQGDHDRAAPLLEEVLTLYGPPGTGVPNDQIWLGFAFDQLADALIASGEVDRAVALTEQALALQHALGSRPGSGLGLIYHAMALSARGDAAGARAAYQESITLLWEVGDKWGIMYGLPWVLGLAVEQAPERVVRLIGAIDALREEIGHRLPPRHAALHARVIATARAALGPSGFEAAQTDGRALSLDQAIAEVKTLLATTVTTDDDQARLDVASPISTLTTREAEVLRLIAAGYSNRQVANALFISPRTASTHAANILGKLGLSSRAEAIAFAHRHGLT